MEITKTLQPGDMGTLNLVDTYGKQLVCVRYRSDEKSQKRYTTVELIVSEKPMQRRTARYSVLVKIRFEETELRNRVKAAGARWNSQEKAWLMDYRLATKMKLKDRIIRKILKTND